MDWESGTSDTQFVVTAYAASPVSFLRDEKLLYTKELVLQNVLRSKAFQEA